MKFLHTADFHIGKTQSGHSLLRAQRAMLDRLVALCRVHRPDALLIAGDIYESHPPSSAEFALFGGFLESAAAFVPHIFAVPGNHDNGDYLNNLGALPEKLGLHFAPHWDGRLRRVTLTDAHGDVDVTLLPFMRPVEGRSLGTKTYAETIHAVLATAPPRTDRRNILLAHQRFLAAPDPTQKTPDISMLTAYDYVALGHEHNACFVGRETVRYAGAPVRRAQTGQSVTHITLGAKGDVSIDLLPITDDPCLRFVGAADPETKEDTMLVLAAKPDNVALQTLSQKFPRLCGVKLPAEKPTKEQFFRAFPAIPQPSAEAGNVFVPQKLTITGAGCFWQLTEIDFTGLDGLFFVEGSIGKTLLCRALRCAVFGGDAFTGYANPLAPLSVQLDYHRGGKPHTVTRTPDAPGAPLTCAGTHPEQMVLTFGDALALLKQSKFTSYSPFFGGTWETASTGETARAALDFALDFSDAFRDPRCGILLLDGFLDALPPGEVAAAVKRIKKTEAKRRVVGVTVRHTDIIGRPKICIEQRPWWATVERN